MPYARHTPTCVRPAAAWRPAKASRPGRTTRPPPSAPARVWPAQPASDHHHPDSASHRDSSESISNHATTPCHLRYSTSIAAMPYGRAWRWCASHEANAVTTRSIRIVCGGREVGGQGFPVRGLRRGAGELVLDFLVGDRRAERAGQDGLDAGGDFPSGAGGGFRYHQAAPRPAATRTPGLVAAAIRRAPLATP
jgi:hypothetical protein